MSDFEAPARACPFNFKYQNESTAEATMEVPGSSWRVTVYSPDRYTDEHGIDAVWWHHVGVTAELISMRLNKHPGVPDNAFRQAHGLDATDFVDHMNTLRKRNRKTVYDDASSMIAAAKAGETGTTVSLTPRSLMIVKGTMWLDYNGGEWQTLLYRFQEQVRQSIAAKRDLVIRPDMRSRYDARASANRARELKAALHQIETDLNFHELAYNVLQEKVVTDIKATLAMTPA